MVKIAVIDPDKLSFVTIRKLASEAAYGECDAYTSVEEFWQKLDGKPRIVFCTLISPAGSCVDLLERAAVEGQLLSVIGMSSWQSVEMLISVIRQGAVTVIPKPVAEVNVARAIEQASMALGRRREDHLQRRIAHQRFSSLSSTERELIHDLLSGSKRKTIAEARGVAVRTIEARRKRVIDKLGVRSDIELARLVTLLATDGEKELEPLTRWPRNNATRDVPRVPR